MKKAGPQIEVKRFMPATIRINGVDSCSVNEKGVALVNVMLPCMTEEQTDELRAMGDKLRAVFGDRMGRKMASKMWQVQHNAAIREFFKKNAKLD